ncbi:TetR/AcrR family transcriptional regulator [Methanosarcina horonobensis]|uniref:TetR/AcrR family transcriptional regulator n=1 Tax=Methanosarcina horonobensis TaxID=418008 RepID=UPI000ADC1D06|nr:TetR/AcrR family transcriptional regulator [Methanosarcina horonobensis]
MYEKGYCNTTMDDIARRLDVSKPALYRYFKNKDELVIESANYLQTQYRDIKTTCNSDTCPVDAWIEIFDQIMSPDIKIHALYFEILGMTVHKPEIQKRSIEGMKHGLNQPVHEITEQQHKGLFHPRQIRVLLQSLSCHYSMECGFLFFLELIGMKSDLDGSKYSGIYLE